MNKKKANAKENKKKGNAKENKKKKIDKLLR